MKLLSVWDLLKAKIEYIFAEALCKGHACIGEVFVIGCLFLFFTKNSLL